MLKVRLNCPICGENILARSLEGHLEKVHELTGAVLLRLNSTHPYAHEPEEAEAEAEEPAEPEPAVEPEPEVEPEPAAEPEPEPEPAPE
ncbi:unnamed protein product [marine sediment metagenome]|uniref:Uncharacterized protein n=1 Tax=marine sediment metagenome TaxID=412755 RepID=X1SZK4_9ZZZZ